MIVGYRIRLLWPWLGLILVGIGFIADRERIFWVAGTFMVLLGLGGVGGWLCGLIDCQETYDSLCVPPPDGDGSGARFVLVRSAAAWEWRQDNALGRAHAALKSIVDFGPDLHEEGCPGDDTCGCYVVGLVNDALREEER